MEMHLSVGVSTLVALMAAHRSAREKDRISAPDHDEIARIIDTMGADRNVTKPREYFPD
jgi:hypothetical protein